MKNITLKALFSLFISLFCATNIGYSQSEIIISQYIDAVSGTTPKGIEVFNVSGVDITFSATNNLQVSLGRNGGTCNLLGLDIDSGTLLAGEVWVIGTANLTNYSITNGTNLSGSTLYNFTFNGDDSLELYLGGIIQDTFGTCGDSGPWFVNGVDSRNNNLQVIDGLCDGDIDGWLDPSERFTEIADGETMTGFGNAPAVCSFCSSPAVTWDGTAWIGGTPSLTTAVEINGDYDTSTGGAEISFSACKLTINNNATLNIGDNNFVEVENELIVETGSRIEVQPYGAFVQNNDDSYIINDGTTSVDKITAPMNAWYEYTYWSSPVSEETIEGAIVDSEPSRRFIFKGYNFLDVTAETNNDDTPVAGQDDIDDNGDDWSWVNGATVMQPGVGYATTLTELAYDTAPGVSNKTFRFTFEGDFNNGIISVPLYRNDSEMADNNWNLIGNPYPSAIDADAFLASNANIDGAIYLWSQNTAYSGTENGNEAANFSIADYAIINGMGSIPGGDGIDPLIAASGVHAIPSGQAFFVSMSNAAPGASLHSGDIYTADVLFNNSMRVSGADDNSKFFKNSNTKKGSGVELNKLWLNLTSDNGVFNQALIGYADNATNNDDGAYFDAKKNGALVTSAILYSNIEGSNNKFAIQGKATTSLDTDEIINLGLKTNIEVATLYKLSIAKLQGDFLTNNTVYLKDNLLDELHILSDSDYSFTSEVGEFNDRFEIRFSSKVLSTEDVKTNSNTLKIIELGDDNVQFKTSNNIKTVKIFDLLGRELYNLKGNSNDETYNLSKLSSTIYVAKVELSNGVILTKKALKN